MNEWINRQEAKDALWNAGIARLYRIPNYLTTDTHAGGAEESEESEGQSRCESYQGGGKGPEESKPQEED